MERCELPQSGHGTSPQRVSCRSQRGPARSGSKKIRALVNADLPVIPVVWYDYNVSISDRIAFDSVPIDALEVGFWIDRVKWVS